MSGARNRYGTEEKCIESFSMKTEGKEQVEDLSVEGE